LLPIPGSVVPVPNANEDPYPDNNEEVPRSGLLGRVKPDELYPFKNAGDNPVKDPPLLFGAANTSAVTGTVTNTRIVINPAKNRHFFNNVADVPFILSPKVYFISNLPNIIK
jgi:hypothetical protein